MSRIPSEKKNDDNPDREAGRRRIKPAQPEAGIITGFSAGFQAIHD
jgi:hypothetical protein